MILQAWRGIPSAAIKEVFEMMNKQTIQFATVNQNHVIQKIGKSVLLQPKVYYDKNRKATKWFDDTKLIKRKK